jgi:hypothetical protein
MASRRWLNSRQFLQELELVRLEREERRKAEVRRVNKYVRLGVASADELRLIGPPSKVGRVD